MPCDENLENQTISNTPQNDRPQETKPRPSENCLDLAKQTSILSVFSDSLKSGGFAGPTHVPELVFLTLCTRVDKPGSLVIKGPSSSGKSYALAAALQYVPKTAYELFHGMSERAILYLKIDLKHKFLIIQEAGGFSEGVGRVFLRQLLSEGEVRYATVNSTADGLVGQELPRIEGPTGLIMTTTSNGLHHEDETRLLSVRMDESPERIRESLRAQAAVTQRTLTEDQLAPWHELHDFVCNDSSTVLIPYAESLAECMPISHNRIARDFPQVLSLIRAHARLHQLNRTRNEKGRILATMEDYAVTHRLVVDVLAQGLEMTVPPHVRQVVEAVVALSRATPTNANSDFAHPVSQRRLAEHLHRDQSVISRNVQASIEAGYLINQNPGQGREASLILGEHTMPSGQALPTPEELTAALEKKARPFAPVSVPIVVPTKERAMPF